MPNLYKSDGTKTTNENEIRCHVKEFCKKLYTFRQKKGNLNEKLDWSKITILTDTLRDSLEGPINNEEALNALKSMKNNKSPRSDGFSTEFFNFFWNDLGKYIVKSINTRFRKKELPTTQKEGVIICLPKGKKDKRFLKNWRPITLLNVTYKMASSLIANRI